MLAACWPMHLAVTGLNNAKPVKAVRRFFTRFECLRRSSRSVHFCRESVFEFADSHDKVNDKIICGASASIN